MTGPQGEMPQDGPSDYDGFEVTLRSVMQELETAGLQLAAAYVAMAIDALSPKS